MRYLERWNGLCREMFQCERSFSAFWTRSRFKCQFRNATNICLWFSHRRTNYRVSAEYVCEIYQFNAATTQYLNLKILNWQIGFARKHHTQIVAWVIPLFYARLPRTESNYFESLDGDGFFSQSNTSFGWQSQCITYGHNTWTRLLLLLH